MGMLPTPSDAEDYLHWFYVSCLIFNILLCQSFSPSTHQAFFFSNIYASMQCLAELGLELATSVFYCNVITPVLKLLQEIFSLTAITFIKHVTSQQGSSSQGKLVINPHTSCTSCQHCFQSSCQVRCGRRTLLLIMD